MVDLNSQEEDVDEEDVKYETSSKDGDEENALVETDDEWLSFTTIVCTLMFMLCI